MESFAAYRLPMAVLGTVALASACGDAAGPEPGPGPEPVVVASVEVTSPIGALLDVGGSTRLTATAKNQAGAAVGGVSFTWTTSDAAVVSIDGTGSIQAVAVGTATLRAAAGSASGSLPVRVVDADLAGITTRSTDPFLAELVAAASADVRTRLQAAVSDCGGGAGQGSLERIQDCVAAIHAEATTASDPTDRVLLAVLSLFIDDITRLLSL